MLTYFFIGTLMDDDIVRHVLGRTLASLKPHPAIAHGFQRYYVRGASYPGLIQAPGQDVEGIVTERITMKDANLLREFEGRDFAEQTLPVITEDGRALEATAFVPKATVKMTDVLWSLEGWRKRGKQDFITSIR